MQPHADKLDKIALCVSSCMVAKDDAVSLLGIGEDLPYTLFGWRGDGLVAVAQMNPSLMTLDHDIRLKKTIFCATVLRRGFEVDALTFAAEAYVSTDPEKTAGKPLDEAFAQPDSGVEECLTFTHVDADGVSLVVAPYRQVLGRKVEWGRVAEQTEMGNFRDAVYPAVLSEVLGLEPMEMPKMREVFYGTLVSGLFAEGFAVQIMQ